MSVSGKLDQCKTLADINVAFLAGAIPIVLNEYLNIRPNNLLPRLWLDRYRDADCQRLARDETAA